MRNFLCFSHLLFVDDVILFGLGIVRKVAKYKEILDLYNKDTRMEVNVHKFLVLYIGLKEEVEKLLRVGSIYPMPLT